MYCLAWILEFACFAHYNPVLNGCCWLISRLGMIYPRCDGNKGRGNLFTKSWQIFPNAVCHFEIKKKENHLHVSRNTQEAMNIQLYPNIMIWIECQIFREFSENDSCVPLNWLQKIWNWKSHMLFWYFNVFRHIFAKYFFLWPKYGM